MPRTPDRQPLVSSSSKRIKNDFLYHSVADTSPENTAPLCPTPYPTDCGLYDDGEEFQNFKPGSPTARDAVTSATPQTSADSSPFPANRADVEDGEESRSKGTEELPEIRLADQKKVILVMSTVTHPHRTATMNRAGSKFSQLYSRWSVADHLTFALGIICGWICSCRRAMRPSNEIGQIRHVTDFSGDVSAPDVSLRGPLGGDKGYRSLPSTEGDCVPEQEGSTVVDSGLVEDKTPKKLRVMEPKRGTFFIDSDTDLESEEEHECDTAKFAGDKRGREKFHDARGSPPNRTRPKASLLAPSSTYQSKPSHQLRNKWTSFSPLAPFSATKVERSHAHSLLFSEACDMDDDVPIRGRLELLTENVVELDYQEGGLRY